VQLPRGDGETKLVAALEGEPGITRMQLDAASLSGTSRGQGNPFVTADTLRE